MRKSGFLVALVAAVIAGCGGGGAEDDAFQPAPPPPSTTPAATISTVTLATSSPTLQADTTTSVEISAFVRNASNQFVEGVPVLFSADTGGVVVTQGTTDASGVAKATLSTAGELTRRTITVTATAGTTTQVSGTVRVDVIGTTLAITGPVSLSSGQQGAYTITLKNAAGLAIAGRVVTVSSARSNPLTPASVTTDTNGTATFTMTAANNAADTLTATSLGVTSTLAVAVNTDSFTFTSPAASPVTEIPLNTPRTVTVRWTIAGAAQVGQTISFTSTRGTVTASAVTDGTGAATATISATNAGAAIIAARAPNGSTAQVAVEFVAQTPASIDVQPSVFTIETGQQSTITAIVRDAAGNLVKNQTVGFTLTDVTGGTLSAATGVTDSQGRAQTIYTASSQTSANEGVQITAAVGAVTKTVALTVARRQVFISLGTGNTLAEPNTAQYSIEYLVQVTDSNGNGVGNVPVSMRILSTRYFKGGRVPATAPATGWTTVYSVAGGCADEDVNRNGQLDPGEDFNTSGRIEAGNIALVSPSNATTDADGRVVVTVSYPQEFAYYLNVELSASTTVQGTEFVRTSRFLVQGTATDFNTVSQAPPGPVSPFGTGTTCSDPN